MNPLLQLLLVALAAFVGIFLIALVSSVVFLAAGKRISQKQFDGQKARLAQLLGGDETLAEKLLDGEAALSDCPEENRAEIETLLEAYRREQEYIQKTAEEQQKKRPTKGRIRKFLTDKKERGEWQ